MANEQLGLDIVATQNVSQEAAKINAALVETQKQFAAAGSAADKMSSRMRGLDSTLKQQRVGLAQTGMQINDFVTSVSTGASPIQAFNQQLGQLGYSMSLMGGTAGRVGAFLAGPWGAAIIAATALLGPAIANMFGFGDATKKSGNESETAAEKNNKLADSLKNVNAQFVTNTKIQLEQNKVARARLEREIGETEKRIKQFGGQGQTGGFFSKELGRMIGPYSELKAQLADTKVEAVQLSNAFKFAEATFTASGKKQEAAVKSVSSRTKAATKDVIDFKAALDAMRDAPLGTSVKSPFETFAPEIKMASTELDPFLFKVPTIIQQLSEVNQAAAQIGETFSQSFAMAIVGAGSFKDAFKGLANSVVAELMRIYVVKQITGFISNAISGVLSAPANLSSPLGPLTPKAIGGAVASGSAYLVGERGPELFVPNRNGAIVPNGKMGSGGMTFNIDARGAGDPAAVRAMVEQGIVAAAPAIIAAAEARTLSKARRPMLPGVI